MPRPPADTVQLTFRVPSPWLAEADAIADLLSKPGMRASRTDAFRAAIARGFEVLRQEAKTRTSYVVSGFDGRKRFHAFEVTHDRDAAIQRADEIARAKRNDRWTVIGVYESGADEPIHTVAVKKT